MILGRILWALVLSAALGYTFHRAWKWEHGAEAELLFPARWGKESFILIPPTAFFWILLLFLIIYLHQFGASVGFARFAALAADVFLTLSVYFLLLLALLPLLRKTVSARLCATLWLIPAFLFWQAHALISVTPLPRWTIYIPRRALPVIAAIWLAGFLAVGGRYLLSHLRFCAALRKSRHEEQDAAVLELFRKTQEALDYRRPVALLRADVPAPFSMGQIKATRCLVLPRRSYRQQELSLIFLHELHHLQRCDVNTKIFLCLCNAVCWFDPLVWLATRRAAEDLERSCDEIVTEGMAEEERKEYARLILSSAAPERACTTCLSAASGTLRYRLKSITEPGPSHRGTLLLMVAIFLCVLCFGLVSVSDARGSFSELLLSEDDSIRSVYSGAQYDEMDEDALRLALSEIELEHVAGFRMPTIQEDSVTLVLSGGRFVELSEDAALVRGPERGGDCYLVTNSFDLSAIRALLNHTA